MLLGVLLIASVPVALAAEEGNRELANALVDASDKVLIEQGVCKDKKDCVAKELVFFEAERRDSVYLSLYNVRNASAIEKIVSICLQKYEENQRKKTIVLLVRDRPHREYGTWQKIFGDSPIEVRLKGE